MGHTLSVVQRRGPNQHLHLAINPCCALVCVQYSHSTISSSVRSAGEAVMASGAWTWQTVTKQIERLRRATAVCELTDLEFENFADFCRANLFMENIGRANALFGAFEVLMEHCVLHRP